MVTFYSSTGVLVSRSACDAGPLQALTSNIWVALARARLALGRQRVCADSKGGCTPPRVNHSGNPLSGWQSINFLVIEVHCSLLQAS